MTMNCSQVQERLSAYIDNELSDAEHHDIAAHLQGCPDCKASVEFARTLSYKTRELADPTPPANLWARIESGLQEKESPVHKISSRRRLWHMSVGQWALAASLLLVAAAGLWSYHFWGDDHGHDSMAASFDIYLAKFAVDPGEAHETLIATYGGQPVSPDEAERVFGYRPIASTGALADVTVEQTYSLDMPCCRCMLSVCRRTDGTVVSVLEHADSQPVWFGDRSRIECLCDGVPTSVVQLNGKLAVSWQYDKRHITVIGATDLEEVTQMVAGLNQMPNG